MSENYGELIKEIRKEKGITIIELAAKMGVSQTYIARLEQGEIKPTKEQMEIIHDFIEGKK